MIFSSWKYPLALQIGRVFHGFGKRFKLLSASRAHCHLLPSATEPTHTRTADSDDDTLSAAAIVCGILERGGRWDCLTASCTSMKLSDSLIEMVLRNMSSDPSGAKRVLLFFHWCSQQRKHQHGLRSYCVVVHILVRVGLVTDASALVESAIMKHSGAESSGLVVGETLLSTYELAPSGPLVFDLLLQSYAKLRLFEEALESCYLLSEQGFLPGLASFNKLLHLVEKSDRFDMAWRIYEHMVCKRRYPNQATIEIMINALCKGGALQKLVDTLDIIHGKRCSPSVVVSVGLILRIIEENRSGEVFVLLKRMLQKNLILDDIAYSLTIHAYCKMGNLELAHSSYEEMLKRGHNANSFIYTSFIGLHCEEGKMKDARRLMLEMESEGLKPYGETYNFLMLGSSKIGESEESLGLCTDMLSRGLLPGRAACNEMISKLCEDGKAEKANKIFNVLLDKGFVPDEVSYSILIDGFGKIGCSHEILKLYHEMEGRGPFPGLITYTSVVHGLLQCRKFKEAEKIAIIMRKKSLASSQEIHALFVGLQEKENFQ